MDICKFMLLLTKIETDLNRWRSEWNGMPVNKRGLSSDGNAHQTNMNNKIEFLHDHNLHVLPFHLLMATTGTMAIITDEMCQTDISTYCSVKCTNKY